jgi:hypothetical protein
MRTKQLCHAADATVEAQPGAAVPVGGAGGPGTTSRLRPSSARELPLD